PLCVQCILCGEGTVRDGRQASEAPRAPPMIDRLIQALQERMDDVGWPDAADAIWLASALLEGRHRATTPSAGAGPGPGRDQPDTAGMDRGTAAGQAPGPEPPSPKREPRSEEPSAPLFPRPPAPPVSEPNAVRPGPRPTGEKVLPVRRGAGGASAV